MKNTLTKAWLIRLCSLLAFSTTSFSLCYGQANYMNIFGDHSVDHSGILGICNADNAMSCAIAPSGSLFVSEASFDDEWGYTDLHSGSYDNFKSSTFDNSGHLLFTTTADGIFGPDGNIIYYWPVQNISGYPAIDLSTTTSCRPYDFRTTAAQSDIVVFPKPGVANSYFILFWCLTGGSGGSDPISTSDQYIIRCVEVDINTSLFGNSSYSTASWYNIAQDTWLDQPTGCSSNDYECEDANGAYMIVADSKNSDCSRDVYTISPTKDSHLNVFGTVQKWHFDSYGNIPTSSTKLSTDNTIFLPTGTKAKILSMPSASGSGNDKYLCYGAQYTGPGSYRGCVQTFDLATNSGTSRYTAQELSAPPHSGESGGSPSGGSWPGDQLITGFDYIPAINEMVFSMVDMSFADPVTLVSIPTGGIGYAPPPIATDFGIYYTQMPPSLENYCFSDLELDKNGDLLMVNTDINTVEAKFAYIPSSSLGSLSALISATPTIVTVPSCSSYGFVPVYNYKYDFVGHQYLYLPSQIRGEDYNSWSTDIAETYTVTATETWNPTNNPVYNASHSATPIGTISANNIVIAPGGSLTIENMTVEMQPSSHIDVYNSSSSSGLTGGRLTLNSAILTTYQNNCENMSGMWGGVRVWGDPGQSQASPHSSSPTYSHQGMLTMINGSLIEYAHTGVYVGEPSFLTFGGIRVPWFPSGGGILQASNSTFDNNNIDVAFWPYSNFFSWAPSIEQNNLSNFSSCNFQAEDPTVAVTGQLIGIYGAGIKGLSINACNFMNNTGLTNGTYGIYASNMGFTVREGLTGSVLHPTIIPSTFSNFENGIYHLGTSASYTPNISGSVFNNNYTGVLLKGSIAPVVGDNTFNVPHPLTGYVHPSSSIEAMGVNLQSADLYSIYGNLFQEATGGVGSSTPNTTVGILAWNTEIGTEDNMINNNTYKALSTANLSNYSNNSGTYGVHGLWYKCNTNSSNASDISVVADASDFPGGIRDFQGFPPSTTSTTGITAGNIFTNSSVPYQNIWNNSGFCSPINYYYNGSVTGERPNIVVGGVALSLVAATPQCTLPYYQYQDAQQNPISGVSGHIAIPRPAPIPIVVGGDPSYSYEIMLNNVNYYMTDSQGVTHRDSLYYWMGQINSTASRLATAYMLAEDGYADSANTLFHSIPSTDSLDSMQSAIYTQGGSTIFNAQSKVLNYYANIRRDVIAAYSDSVDVDSLILSDSSLVSTVPFDSTSQDSVISVFNTSLRWSRIMAENTLCQFNPGRAAMLLTAAPDTFLLPSNTDSLAMRKDPNGVLAVTEASKGPSSAGGGCQYAEVVVANCGTDASAYVDVSGWIIDDNSGNFDTAGCTSGAGTITRGHYRLSPTSAGWQNIPVGSVLVLYNAANNCYNMPDTFHIDTAHLVFWIPINSTTTSYPSSYAVERFDGAENASASSYCSDTGTTVYTPAYSWATTMNFDNADAVQVRCPGCTSSHPESPAFYHGVGFAPDTTYCFNAIPQTPVALGAALEMGCTAYKKYVFTGGSSISDFNDPTQWVVSTADAAGTIPATAGNIDSTLYSMITNHLLNLPCCSSYEEGERKSNTSKHNASSNSNLPMAQQQAQTIRVFPNPASMTINFLFPIADNIVIRITDVTGRVMDEQTILNGSSAIFNVRGYASGIYIYQISTNGQLETGKFVVE